MDPLDQLWQGLPPIPQAAPPDIMADLHAANPRMPNPISGPAGFARQVAQGIPFIGPWTDEAAAGVMSALPHGGNYGDNLARLQGENNQFTHDNPGATLGARTLGTGGGILAGLAAAPEALGVGLGGGITRAVSGGAAKLMPRVGQAMGIGAATGFEEGMGYGDGNLGDRTRNGIGGALLGAGTGVVAPLVAPLIPGAVGKVANAYVKGKAERSLPGSTRVANEGPVPRPQAYSKEYPPSAIVGDLSPRYRGLTADIGADTGPAADTVNNALNTPARTAPNPADTVSRQTYDQTRNLTNQTAADRVMNPQPPKQGAVSTGLKAAARSAPMVIGTGFHPSTMALGVGNVVSAILGRGRGDAKPIAERLGPAVAQDIANVLAMGGKSTIDKTTGKMVNPGIDDAASVINGFLASRSKVGKVASGGRRVLQEAIMGAGNAAEPQFDTWREKLGGQPTSKQAR